MNPYQNLFPQQLESKKPAVNPLLEEEALASEQPDLLKMLKASGPVRKPAMVAPAPSGDDLQSLMDYQIAMQDQVQPQPKVSASNVAKYGEALRATPEWKRQEQGLGNLEAIVGIDAQKNANRQSIDLSPLGAYFDYQNALRGKPTQLAKSFQVAPAEDDSLKNLAELQRRRGDMSKGLVEGIKALAPKESSGLGQDRLEGVNFSRVIGEKHKMFDNSDKALGALNTLVRELGEQIPSDLNRLQIQRAMADMNGMRPALAEVMMESGNQTLFNKMQQIIDKNFTKGSHLTETDLKEFWESARSSLAAIKTDRRGRAEQLKAIADGYKVSPEKLKKIIHQRYIDYGTTSNLEDMPMELPKKGAHGAAPEAPKKPSLSPEDMQAIMDAVNGGN
jgi:hypothetical protein